MSSPKRDTTPGLTTAGMTSSAKNESITDCLSQPLPPATPDNIKRFRHGSTRPLGKSGRHYGLAVDAPRDVERTYGGTNKFEGTVNECLTPNKHTLVAARLTQQEIKEPLGRSPLKSNVKLPEATQKESFAFGMSTDKSENAQNIIYPANMSAANGDNTKMDCGYQKERNYDWTANSINPASHRFGKTNDRSGEGASAVFRQQDSALVNSPTKAQRMLKNAEVGSPRRQGFAPVMEDTHSFGKKLKKDEYTVNELVKGIGAPQQSGDDIGLPVYRNPHVRHLRQTDRMNLTSSSGELHTFGVPSVRSDLTAPRNEKITNNTNFGADPDASQLLYPVSPGDTQGLGLKPLSLGEAVRLAQRCQFDLTEEQVHLCYKVALKNSGPRKVVSARSFMDAIEQAGF